MLFYVSCGQTEKWCNDDEIMRFNKKKAQMTQWEKLKTDIKWKKCLINDSWLLENWKVFTI